MVLDITSVSVLRLYFMLGQHTLELSHDDLHRLSHHIGQYVETASMGHTNNKVVSTFIDSGVNCYLKTRNETLATFETEPLHSVEFLGQEEAEIVRPVESVVQVDLLCISHTVVLDALEVEADPVADVALGNVRELDSDLAAVGGLVCLNDVFELPGALLGQDARLVRKLNVELSVKVMFGEPVLLVVEEREQRASRAVEFLLEGLDIIVGLLQLEGVQVGHEVTHRFERVQQSREVNGLFGSAVRCDS